MTKIAYRNIQSLMLILSVGVFLGSLYLQFAIGLHPCPLCLMQRWTAFTLILLMGVRLGTQAKAHVVSFLKLIVSAAGLFFAIRQLYLQSLPPEQAPACLPGLDILVKYFPWQAIVKALIWGTGECAEAPWTIFGISLAGYGAIYFTIMVVLSLILFVRTRTVA